jgi:subtilisin-like proprotein convertase family protein
VTLDVAFAGAPATNSETSSGRAEPRLAIKDGDPNGVESVIALRGAGSVREVAVEVAIAHGYIGDLRVELIAPSGLRAALHDRTGANTRDIRRVFRSSELSSLAALGGASASGDWRLRVTDTAPGDTGTLESWGIALVVEKGSDVVRRQRTPALAIPDDDAAGISDSVTLVEAGLARSIRVKVDISHPYAGDLRLELVSPTGDRALLQNRAGAGQRDLKATFASLDTPGLGALIGQPLRGTWALRVSDLAGRDTGKLNAWELEIGKAASARTMLREVAPNLPIPDDDSGGVRSSLVFPEGGTLQAVTLKASIEHPYVGDLIVALVAPSGERAVLWNRQGGRTRDLSLDLDSARIPALAKLVGQPVEGPWLLEISDLAKLDAGTLKSWALGLTFSAA